MKMLVSFGLLMALGGHAQTAPCTAREITLSFPSEPGEFTGMSHDGTWMVLRNTGHRTCTVPRRPILTLRDTDGKPLPVTLNVPAGMHPGPVLVAVRLRPRQSAQASLRWVMGEVYDKSVCVNIAKASFNAPGGEVTAPLKARMCGEESDGVHFDQEWLQPASGRRSH